MELGYRNLTTTYHEAMSRSVSHHRLSNEKCIQTVSLLLLTGHGDNC
jgi:hypothetical protein